MIVTTITTMVLITENLRKIAIKPNIRIQIMSPGMKIHLYTSLHLIWIQAGFSALPLFVLYEGRAGWVED